MQDVSAGYVTASQDDDQYVKAKVDLTLADSRHVDNLKVSSSSESYEAQVVRLAPNFWWKMDSVDPFDYSGGGFHGVSSGSVGDPSFSNIDRYLNNDAGFYKTVDPSDLSLGWVEGDGSSTIYVTTAGVTNLNTATDTVRVEALVQVDDLTPAGNRAVLGSAGSELQLILLSAGALQFRIEDSVGTNLGATSTDDLASEAGMSDADAIWVAAEYNVDGTVTFEYSSDTDTTNAKFVTGWTPFSSGPETGTALASGSGTLASLTSLLWMTGTGLGTFWDGKLFSNRVIYDDVVVSTTDMFTDADRADTSWTGFDGLTHTVTGSSVTLGVGSLDIQAKFLADDYTPVAALEGIFHHWNGFFTSKKSWMIALATSGAIASYFSHLGSDSIIAYSSDVTTTFGVSDGEMLLYRSTYNWATGDVNHYYSSDADSDLDNAEWVFDQTDNIAAGPLYDTQQYTTQYNAGAFNYGFAEGLSGEIYEAAAYSNTSANGSAWSIVIADFGDSAQFLPSQSTGYDATSNEWTPGNAGYIGGALPIKYYDPGYLDFENTTPVTDEQYVSNSTYTMPSSFSLSAWVQWDNAATTEDEYLVSSAVGAGASDVSVILRNTSAGGSYAFELSDGSTIYEIEPTSSTIPDDWHHVLLCVDDTTWTFYIDGVETDSDTWTGPLNVSVANLDAGLYFNGFISDIVIFDYVLTDKQAYNLYSSGGENGGNKNLLVDRWFSPSQLINGVEKESGLYGYADAVQYGGGTIVANGDVFALPPDPDDAAEYGFYTRTDSNSAGSFDQPESVFAEFDERIANYINFTTSSYFGRIKTATLYYKDTSDVWQSHAAVLATTDTEYEWDLGSDLSIKGVGIEITSTHNANDVGRVHELIPLFKKSVTDDDYLVNFEIGKVRENLEMTVPIGNTAANTFNVILDNTEQIWSPDGSSTYSSYMISDIKVEPFITYEDVPTEWLPQGVFYADTINSDGESMTINIPCRDYSKYLQSNQVEGGVFFRDLSAGDAIINLARKYGVPYSKTSVIRNFWKLHDELQPTGLWKLDEKYSIDDTEDTYVDAGQFLRLTPGAYAYASSFAYDELTDGFTVDIDIALHDWASESDQHLLGQINAGPSNHMWAVYVNSDGKLQLTISTNGTTKSSVSTTKVLGFDDYSRHYLRVVRNGEFVSFFEKKGDSFELIETVSGLASGTIYSGSSLVTVGVDAGGGGRCFGSDVYYVKTWDGLDIPADDDTPAEEPVSAIDVDFTETDNFVLGNTSGVGVDGVTWVINNGPGKADLVTTFVDSVGGHRGAGIIKDIEQIAVGEASLLNGYPDYSSTKFDISDGETSASLKYSPPDYSSYTTLTINSDGTMNPTTLDSSTDYVVSAPDIIDGIGLTESFVEDGPDGNTFDWFDNGSGLLPEHSDTDFGGFTTTNDQESWKSEIAVDCTTINATTGSFDFIFYGSFDDLTSSFYICGWDYDAEFYVQAGVLRARVREDAASGSNSRYFISGVQANAHYTNNTGAWWRCKITASDDTAEWFKSSDARTTDPTAVSWTSITTDVEAAWNGTANSETTFTFGKQASGSGDSVGRVYTELDGTAVVDIDPANVSNTSQNAFNLIIQGCRNLVWIGGEIQVDGPTQAESTAFEDRRALSLKNINGIAYLEGLYIHGDWLSEGIDFSDAGDNMTCYLQNYRCENLTYTYNGGSEYQGHPDALQPFGGWADIYIDKMTVTSEYQGLFSRVAYNTGGNIYMSRANFRMIDTVNGDGAHATSSILSMWTAPVGAPDGHDPIYAEEIYVSDDSGTRTATDGIATMVTPALAKKLPVLNGTTLTWPETSPDDYTVGFRNFDDSGIGEVTWGDPAEYDFVSAVDVGVNYVTPSSSPGQGILVDNSGAFFGMAIGFTVGGLVSIDVAPDNNGRILSWSDVDSGPETLEIYIDSSRHIVVNMTNDTGSGSFNETTSAQLTLGSDHFFAVRYDGDSTLTVWIDDTKETFTSSSFGGLYLNANTPIGIGRHSVDESYGFKGSLQALALYDYAISDATISNLYKSSQIAEIDIFPYLYGIDSSVWDIMLEWATADVGIFYFDENDNFVYESRTILTEGAIDRHANAQHSFNDDIEIVSGTRLAEVTANKINVKVNPITTINSGRQGIWRAENNESLAIAKLAEAFDKNEDQQIRVGSTDKPLWKDSGFFKIGDEIIKYESKTGRHFKELTRGMFGTTPANHGTKVWDFEDQSINGMRDFFNCNLSISSTQAQEGSYSMKVEVTDEDDGIDRLDIIGPAGISATPIAKEAVDLSVYVYAETAARNIKVGLNWYNVNGEYLSTSYGTASAATLGGWKEYTASAAAPRTSKYATPHIWSDDSVLDDVFYVDNIQMSGGIRKKVREVRQYFIEFDSAPAIGVKEPFIVARDFEDRVDIDFIAMDEFGGEIIVSANQNNAFSSIVLLEGTDPTTELNYYFSISGVPLIEESETDEVIEIDESIAGSIRRHQVYELIIDNRFIQNEDLAQKIADYLLEHYKNPVPILELQTMGVPYLQLGDRIEVAAYDQLSITNKEFWITAQNITYDGGLSDAYTLREVS